MERRRWESKEKAQIVLDGLRGRPIAEVCNTYQISQAQYYQWRDQFLGNASRAFEVNQQTAKETRLLKENAKLKGLVGELTLELKKNDDWLI